MLKRLQLHTFLHWWGEGLYAGLPVKIRKLFQSSLPNLILQLHDGNRLEVVWQQDGKLLPRGVFSLQDMRLFLADVLPKPAQHKPYKVMLRLGKNQVLQLQHYFPEAVKDNLRQVVSYQLDRLTPFTTDNALFDARLTKHDKLRKEICADIYVTPKLLVEKLSQQLQEAGIKQIQQVSVVDVPDINLLQLASTGIQSRGSKVAIYFVISALLIALLAPLAYQWRKLDKINAALAELRHSSTEQMAMRDKLLEAGDALKFLEEKRKTSPVALDVVEKLSSLIPEHTWLDQLTIDGKTLEISGESGKALSLIDVLENAPEFANVRFKSPVVRNKDNGRDRFQIEATLETPHAP